MQATAGGDIDEFPVASLALAVWQVGLSLEDLATAWRRQINHRLRLHQTEQNRTERNSNPCQAKPSRRPLWLNNFYSRHHGALNREVWSGKGWSMGGWQDGPQDNPCEKWVVAALNASAMVSELTAQRHSHTLVGIWLLILHIYKNQTIYICDTYSSCMQLVAVSCESELAR